MKFVNIFTLLVGSCLLLGSQDKATEASTRVQQQEDMILNQNMQTVDSTTERDSGELKRLIPLFNHEKGAEEREERKKLRKEMDALLAKKANANTYTKRSIKNLPSKKEKTKLMKTLRRQKRELQDQSSE